ncbi:putative Zn-dependent peptidase [Rhizomicrobium palustre]|uniref:Putative Zn-dependent peptidase n=1 Tax=Rhizomicrobium palustre TaxID=189966 RepID=A0A846N2B3_9PROT|nr:pitrilysin family protein [Rhizomicrobium palustre]NIK89362.1 putative Zn-dependent peptidase [Rhizomicrobium palustre]
MNVKISRLSNGLIVATDPMSQLESAAVGVWVSAGARHETKPIMGVSHMLEHMAFKGTRRRTARSIAEEIEAVGGFLNAYTSREQTAFHARVLRSDVPLAVDILADILTEPGFAKEELERERQVVLQEIGQAKDTPDDIIFDYLQAVAYPDQPMGWPILGTEETVSGFAQQHLRAYMAANYRSGSMVLIGSGAVDHDMLVRLAEEKFAALPNGTATPPEPSHYMGGELHEGGDLEQCHIAYAFPGVSTVHPDYLLSQVYATALGGGMSSRLFQEVREKRGLCYSIYAFAQAAKDDGILGVYTGTGENEAAEIGAIVAGEMASLAETASDAEVARAKAQLKSSLLMGLERPATRSELIAGHIFNYDRVLTVEEMTENLEAIDTAQVRRFAQNVMETANPAVATVGPAGKLERYGIFAGRFGGKPAVRAAE